jgi:hypothetical protein
MSQVCEGLRVDDPVRVCEVLDGLAARPPQHRLGLLELFGMPKPGSMSLPSPERKGGRRPNCVEPYADGRST